MPRAVPLQPAETTPAAEPVDPELAERARSTRRVVLVVLLVLAVCTAGLGVIWQTTGLWNPTWGTPIRVATCPNTALRPANPQETKVNVYNATERVGKATAVSAELKKRGFRIGSVANSELPADVLSGPGIILTGPDALDRALALQRQVPKMLIKLQPERTDGAVDLVLGEGFRSLVRADRVNMAPGVPRCETAPGGN